MWGPHVFNIDRYLKLCSVLPNRYHPIPVDPFSITGIWEREKSVNCSCSQLDVGEVNINKVTILVLQFQIPNEKFQLMITLISVKIQLRKPAIFRFIKKDGMWCMAV